MRVIVFPSEDSIIVDGILATHDLSHIDPTIHAIQWWPEGWGQIEYTVESQKPTITTTAYELVEPYVGIHTAIQHRLHCEAAEHARQNPAVDLP